MTPRAARILRIIEANTRVIASAVAVLLMMSTLVAVRQNLPSPGNDRVAAGDPSAPSSDDPGNGPGGGVGTPRGEPTGIGTGTGSGLATGAGSGLPGPGRTIIPKNPAKGVDYKNKKIKVVFYWNDSSTASPYLKNSGQEGNLDDGVAFETFVKYINKHRNGGATLMGFPFNLHGFQIEPHIIYNVGKSTDNFTYWAGEIVNKIKPFAAMSARSSPSAYMCPPLAAAGIYNFGTYDFYLKPNLADRMSGYCYSLGLSFAKQVDITTAYLQDQAKTNSTAPSNPGKRVYGFLYASYKGLVESAPKVVDRLRAAGINIPKDAVRSVPTDLATAQTQMRGVVEKFKAEGVNTVIMPDAGAPLNFTHAAAANQFFPDYYVWPCSGQDSTGFVRLLNPSQWARAQGLTCYDDTFDTDLTNDNTARASEWYHQYKSINQDEPPAPAPLVYTQLLPLVAGLTASGPDIDPVKFRAGLANFQGYRYSGIDGRTSASGNITVDYDGFGSIWADVAKVRWDPAAPRPGGNPGAYVYPEPARRYKSGDQFS